MARSEIEGQGYVVQTTRGSGKYENKALSARLFPMQGKEVGDEVIFDNPYLTNARIMKLD